MKRIMQFLLSMAIAIMLAAAGAFGQESEAAEGATPPEAIDAPAEAGDGPAAADGHGRPRPKSIERFGSDYTLGSGESANEVVVIRGEVGIDGSVRQDVTSILGEARVGSTAHIRGDLVVLFGPLEIEAGAVVQGDVLVLGGSIDMPAGFEPGGDLVSVTSIAGLVPDSAVPPWISKGFIWGRPIVPELPWAWAFVLVFAAVYLAINFVFERPVRDCAGTLAAKPLTTCLVGVLVLVLIVPVTVILFMSMIGVPIVPFFWLGVALLGLFGRASVFRWLGARVMPETLPGDQLQAARSLAIGMVAVCLAYMVPVLGFTVWVTVGVFGLGAAASTVFDSMRSEQSAGRPVADAGVQEAVEAPADANGLADHPVAGFGPRLGAVAIDLVFLTLLVAILDTRGVLLVALAYHVALWGWKTTTVGGIVCRLRIVRADGAPLQFSDALVRGLSCILSVVAAGLGWFWLHWDPRSQAWHDKIAGTYVVRVPHGHPLP